MAFRISLKNGGPFLSKAATSSTTSSQVPKPGGDYDSDLLFYSRRIGSSPHGSPSLDEGEYARCPQNTAILGAAKFSGKTKKGWSIGLLESVTQRTMAQIDHDGDRTKRGSRATHELFCRATAERYRRWQHRDRRHVYGCQPGKQPQQSTPYGCLLRWTGFSALLEKPNLVCSGQFGLQPGEGSTEVIANTQQAFEHLFQRTNATETPRRHSPALRSRARAARSDSVKVAANGQIGADTSNLKPA